MRGPLTGKFFFDSHNGEFGLILSLLPGPSYHVGGGVPFADNWTSKIVKAAQIMEWELFTSAEDLENFLERTYPEVLDLIE